VSRAAVRVSGDPIAEIGNGLLVLVGIHQDDTEDEARSISDKVANLRIFTDDDGKMNRSVLDVGGEVLVVSQFTLYADTRRGRRPSFVAAALPETAEQLIRSVVEHLGDAGVQASTGRFGAHMEVELTNDGPVTILVES
jgi:D-tyrosyl-tRNA(Tyr) deacylase